MKPKISKILILPMIYGITIGCFVATLLAVSLLKYCDGVKLFPALVGTLVLSLMTVLPAVRRVAWAYSNVRKYHNKEYFYNLGNGVDNNKALAYFEGKALKAMKAWMRHYLWDRSMPLIPVFYFLNVARYGDWIASMWVFVALLLMVVAVLTGTWTMLLVARKLCYDKFGNLKNS